MSKIDFDRLNGESVVASKMTGSLGKVVLPILLLAGTGILAYVNWPSGQGDSSLVENSTEAFETGTGSVGNFAEAEPRQASDTNLVEIPIADAKQPADTANVEVAINESVDLQKQRELLEAQLRAEEERRRAEDDARRRAQEAERLAAEEEARWKRLRSQQIIMDGDAQEGGMGGDQQVAVAGDGQLVAVPGADSDANKAFLAQSEQATTGLVKAQKFARTDALVSQGTLIRGFIETAINTDLPGMVRAVVREDVRSLDGRRVLIPKGSRLVGEYKSGLSRGQKRVFIVWSRVIRSDGMSVEIASPGADRLGRAGMGGIVDTHFFERFGSAIMLSLIGGAAEYVASLGDSGEQGTTSYTTTNPTTGEVTTVTTQPNRSAAEAHSIAAEKSSTMLQDIANEAFKDSAQIPPTIYIAQGEEVIVFVRRDLDFSDLYADPVREELTRLKSGGKIRKAIDPTSYYPDVPVYK